MMIRCKAPLRISFAGGGTDVDPYRTERGGSVLNVTIDKYANTTSGTIPTCLASAVADGRLNKGDLVLIAAFGAGFTWGSMLVRWAY